MKTLILLFFIQCVHDFCLVWTPQMRSCMAALESRPRILAWNYAVSFAPLIAAVVVAFAFRPGTGIG